jgi:hypothetical protein
MAAFLEADDLNGACFIAGELGEIEEVRPSRVVLVPNALPTANVVYEPVTYTAAQSVSIIERNFIQVLNASGARTDVEAAAIAYIRFLALRNGLVSPQFAVNNWNVTYNECIAVGPTDYVPATALATSHPRDAALAADRVRPTVEAALPAQTRSHLRKNFANMVCCVAYLFRVRGHHWLDDMDAKYTNLWRKCLKNEDYPIIKWELLAHDALHAIFPQVLDTYWVEKVRDSNVAGALQKRIDSAPAGVAGVRALEAGMADLAASVPGFRALHNQEYLELERLLTQLRANRWAGSINRRFYAGPDLGFMEARFSGIASTILAALEQFAPTSQLRNSQALKRMAQNAPISGGFTAQLIAAAAKDPENARALVRASASGAP